jgi:hypothetical protein
MLGHRHHTTIFIISIFTLLLKDLLAKFIMTFTLKNK